MPAFLRIDIKIVGKAGLIDKDMSKLGATVTDMELNQTPNGVVGDVQIQEVVDIATWVIPVLRGVGPVTVAMLMQNALRAHDKQTKLGWNLT